MLPNSTQGLCDSTIRHRQSTVLGDPQGPTCPVLQEVHLAHKGLLSASQTILSLAFLSLVTLGGASGQGSPHFAYDTTLPLDIHKLSTENRNGVTVETLTYASPNGGSVPAYLIIPPGKGRFAAIVWGHWLLPGSPVSNRKEFLDEALAIAPAGVVSLLIDAPQARPDFKHAPNSSLIAQQVIDLRRAIDLLLARPDVDAKRMAYVGHSWDAEAGALLDEFDKRPAAFVFMGGPQSNRQYVLYSDSPRMVKLRQSADMAGVEQMLGANAWADPATYAAQLGPAPALFQYGLHDEDWVPLKDAKDFVAMSAGSKEAKFYDADHALNAAARADRFRFLREHLSLAALPPAALASVPQTK